MVVSTSKYGMRVDVTPSTLTSTFDIQKLSLVFAVPVLTSAGRNGAQSNTTAPRTEPTSSAFSFHCALALLSMGSCNMGRFRHLSHRPANSRFLGMRNELYDSVLLQAGLEGEPRA